MLFLYFFTLFFEKISAAKQQSGIKLTQANENFLESLILAQNERWRRGLGMQVERSAETRKGVGG